jgi:hypothetical protein
MRINSENPHNKVSETKPVIKSTNVPVLDKNGSTLLSAKTNNYFTGLQEQKEVLVKEPVKTKQFVVGKDTVVYDEVSGLWKIK